MQASAAIFTGTCRKVFDNSLITINYAGGLQPKTTTPKPAVWILDTSGSMASDIGTLNEVCAAHYSQMKVKPQVISFNTSAEHVQMGPTWTNLYTRGQTCFVSAFEKLRVLNPMDSDILFFTDGGHNSSRNLWNYLETILWTYLAKNRLRLHVIGFGREYDINILQRLVGVSKENSFQYAPNRNDLATVVANISALGESVIKVTVVEDPSKEVFSLVPTGDTLYLLLDGTVPETVKVQVKDDLLYDCQVTKVTTEVSLEDTVRSLEVEIRRMSTSPTVEVLKSLDSRLDELHGQSMKLRGLVRKTVMTRILELKKIVGSAYAVLRNTASQEDRSRLLATAQPIRTANAGLDKRLDKRILEQGNLRADLEAQILKNLKLVDFSKPADPEGSAYECLLTASNYWEALADGDCMGITVIVRRPPVATANSSMLQVLKVNAQFMTVQGFTDALQSGLLKAVDPASETAVHGGFGGTGSVINDRTILPCNAILPLYISSTHWETVARHRMPLALGFMTTLDERGFAKEQWHTVPYLILFAAANQKPSSELEKKVFDALLNTCRALVKKETLETELKEWIGQVKSFSFNRSICGNIRVLLGKMLALNLPLDLVTSLSIYLEELRRCVRRPGPSDTYGRLAEYLKITYTSAYEDWKLPLPPKPMLIWLGEYLQIDFPREDSTLYYAWALAHCDDEQSASTSGCPSPITDPSNAWKWIFSKTLSHCKYLHAAEVAKVEAQRTASSYMTQEDPVFKGMHHLYGGSSFGMFLKTLRACKNVEGALVNAEAKYKYLNSQGWYGGHRNRNAFTTQIAFETEAKEKIKK